MKNEGEEGREDGGGGRVVVVTGDAVASFFELALEFSGLSHPSHVDGVGGVCSDIRSLCLHVRRTAPSTVFYHGEGVRGDKEGVAW